MKIQTSPKPINFTLLWIAGLLTGILGGMFMGPMVFNAAPKYQFYDNKDQVISYHSVDSIVKAAYTSYLREDKNVKVDLPEEYRLIKSSDILKGTYDSLSNTLVIEFNNIQNR